MASPCEIKSYEERCINYPPNKITNIFFYRYQLQQSVVLFQSIGSIKIYEDITQLNSNMPEKIQLGKKVLNKLKHYGFLA